MSNLAFKTRTGYQPGKPDKKNQDIYFASQNFCNIENMYLFGVCDGHGAYGHFASSFIKTALPKNITLFQSQQMKRKGIKKCGLLSLQNSERIEVLR